jgi:hypothetical protein
LFVFEVKVEIIYKAEVSKMTVTNTRSGAKPEHHYNTVLRPKNRLWWLPHEIVARSKIFIFFLHKKLLPPSLPPFFITSQPYLH